MNKRLKELFRQAGFYVDDAGKVWGDPAYHITEQASKLVKLIVEDCADVVYTNEYSSPVNIAFAIEQHFEEDDGQPDEAQEWEDFDSDC